MSRKEKIDALRMQRLDGDGDVDTDVIDKEIWSLLTNNHKEVLRQLLFNGPVWDGYIISKQARDDLFDYGLAARCCFLGEQGYSAATYLAHDVFKAGDWIPIKKRPGVAG